MIIAAPCVVSLTWTMADAQGETLDELTDPVEFFFGGDDLLPKLEEVLQGQEAGFEAVVRLEPEQAFGDYDKNLVCFESRSIFPEYIEVGMHFDGLPEGSVTPGMRPDAIYRISEIYPEHVVLDGNHELAGLSLQLAVQVVAVRAATDEEIEAASVLQDGLEVVMPPAASDQIH